MKPIKNAVEQIAFDATVTEIQDCQFAVVTNEIAQYIVDFDSMNDGESYQVTTRKINNKECIFGIGHVTGTDGVRRFELNADLSDEPISCMTRVILTECSYREAFAYYMETQLKLSESEGNESN